MKDLTKYHAQPCANCGHRDMHGEVAGCIATVTVNPDTWCPCDAYVAPPSREEQAREGRRRAEEGMDRVDASHASTVGDGPAWRAKAEERLDALIAAGIDFTADNVTDVVGEPPTPNMMGPLFRGRKSAMEVVGYGQSTRAAGHARVLRIWRGKQPAQ